MVDNTVYKVLYEGYEMREEDKGKARCGLQTRYC